MRGMLEAAGRFLGTLPVDYITTNVVTNGSSGSATLNAWGELCGLAFDSNWEGVGSDFIIEEDIARTIHVDSRYMLWVMDAVDGAKNLLLIPYLLPHALGVGAGAPPDGRGGAASRRSASPSAARGAGRARAAQVETLADGSRRRRPPALLQLRRKSLDG